MKVTKFVITLVEEAKAGDTVRLAITSPTWRLTQSPAPTTCNGRPAVEIHAEELDGDGRPTELLKVFLEPCQKLYVVTVKGEA